MTNIKSRSSPWHEGSKVIPLISKHDLDDRLNSSSIHHWLCLLILIYSSENKRDVRGVLRYASPASPRISPTSPIKTLYMQTLIFRVTFYLNKEFWFLHFKLNLLSGWPFVFPTQIFSFQLKFQGNGFCLILMLYVKCSWPSKKSIILLSINFIVTRDGRRLRI